MRCGMGEADITPNLGMAIPGDFDPCYGLAVDDPLYVKAAWFEDDNRKALILAIDSVGMPKEDVESVRAVVARQTGIDAADIMVCCTHNHSAGPNTSYPMNDNDPAYFKILLGGCALAARQAQESCEEARFVYGSTEVNHVSFNRRYWFKDGSVRTYPGIGNPDMVKTESGIDPELKALRVESVDGRVIGMIINFACHVTAHIQTGPVPAFSGDYPGAISRRIKEALGENVVSLFLTGCCGDVTQIDFEEKLYPKSVQFGGNHHDFMGKILAERAMTAVNSGETFPAAIKTMSEKVRLTRRMPTAEQYEAAEKYLADYPNPQTRDEFVDTYYAKSAIILYEEGEFEDIELQAFAFGNIVIVGFPAEILHELGMDLKDMVPDVKLFLSTLTNGEIGYIPTYRAFSHGGYEGKIGMTSRFVGGTGEKIIAAAADLVRRILAE